MSENWYTLRDERNTLLKVAELLSTKQLPMCEVAAERGLSERMEIKGATFNMDTSAQEYDCGSVACIGGTAWLLENPKDFDGADDFVQYYYYSAGASDGLPALFFPNPANGFRGNMSDITPAQAAKAIHRYLNNEKNIWDHVQ